MAGTGHRDLEANQVAHVDAAIRELLQECHGNKAALGRRLGVKGQAIGIALNVRPGLPLAKAVAKALHVPLDDLLAGRRETRVSPVGVSQVAGPQLADDQPSMGRQMEEEEFAARLGQSAAGQSPTDDPRLALGRIARERWKQMGEPPEIAAEIAGAEAPPAATVEWWFRHYLAVRDAHMTKK